MDENFSEWYRKVSLDPTDERLKLRWQGIVDFVEDDLMSSDVLELVRLFFDLSVNDKFLEKFITCFSKIDSAFPKKSKFELSVLAGVALTKIVEDYENLGNLVLLTVQTTAFNSRNPSVPDILEEIIKSYNSISADIREGLSTQQNVMPAIPSKTALFEKCTEAKNESIDSFKLVIDDFMLYINKLSEVISQIAKIQIEDSSHQKIYREDSQILWWMTGGWSRDLEKMFKKMKVAEASFISGKELADLITIFPGPYASKAVLHSVLSSFKGFDTVMIDLCTIIDGLDKVWRDVAVNTYSPKTTKQITPLLSALSHSLDVEGEKEWLPTFKKLTSFDATSIKNTSLDFAYQMYLECLVLKCIENIEG